MISSFLDPILESLISIPLGVGWLLRVQTEGAVTRDEISLLYR